MNLLVLIIGVTLSVKATSNGRVENFHDISESQLTNNIASVETYFNSPVGEGAKANLEGKFYKTKKSEAAEFKNTVSCICGDNMLIEAEYFAGSNKKSATTFDYFHAVRLPSFGLNFNDMDDAELIQRLMGNYNSMIQTDLSEKSNVEKASSIYNPSTGYSFRCLDDSYFLSVVISSCPCGKTIIKSADELDRICMEQFELLKAK